MKTLKWIILGLMLIMELFFIIALVRLGHWWATLLACRMMLNLKGLVNDFYRLNDDVIKDSIIKAGENKKPKDNVIKFGFCVGK